MMRASHCVTLLTIGLLAFGCTRQEPPPAETPAPDQGAAAPSNPSPESATGGAVDRQMGQTSEESAAPPAPEQSTPEKAQPSTEGPQFPDAAAAKPGEKPTVLTALGKSLVKAVTGSDEAAETPHPTLGEAPGFDTRR